MEKVGRYRLNRRLGAGSFATVWLGHDDDLDVPVAVKVLADNWAANEDVRDRFLSEARIMRRIRDKRIVQVYDIGTVPDGRPYFVMDYIDGGSMDDLRKERIEPERALRLCAEACRALEVLHRNDIIHRDVTPGNLLLSRDPNGATQVVVADLGVAKSMVDVAGATMTAGTPAYMAPEQASGIGVLDHRADIYSLSALTYAMVTGKPPFTVRSLADILSRDPATTAEPIAAGLGAPETLDALMVSGLAAEPGRRPPSATILGQALDNIADQMHAAGADLNPLPGANQQTMLRPSAPSPQTSYPRQPQSFPQSHPSAPGYSAPSGHTPSSIIGPPASPGTQPPSAPTFLGTSYGAPQGTPRAPAQQPSYGQTHYEQPSSQQTNYQQPTHDPGGNNTQGRPTSFYVLIGLIALAIFSFALFITITLLG